MLVCWYAADLVAEVALLGGEGVGLHRSTAPLHWTTLDTLWKNVDIKNKFYSTILCSVLHDKHAKRGREEGGGKSEGRGGGERRGMRR